MLDECPPMICRFYARKRNGRVPMSNADIAFISGLARCTVSQIGSLRSWRSVPVETVHRFTMACGVNIVNQEQVRKFIRHSRWSHIKHATSPQQKKMLLRILEKLASGPHRALVASPNE